MTKKRLAEEIKQGRPFRDKATEAALGLLRTANLLRRRAEAVTMREGLTLQQYNILRILRGARAPLPTMEIAARLVEQAPGITRLVSVLEERELLRREPWSGDRRQVLCQITPAGLKLLERLDDAIDEYDSSSMGKLSEPQIEQLIEFLEEIRDANE
ncbi:MAG TPA: MarR family transcriptional regulator [Thermoanaerobaculia bacterium]|nr:MarR family transcriptional regulator [Thermoanaerobaculia bacterium]